VVGASEAKVHGFLRDEVVEVIRKATCYTLKTARFSKAYQEGKWDGKSHLFTERTHVFPSGILDRVCSLLTACRVVYDVVDQRDRTDVSQTVIMPLRSSVELRPYQQQALETAIAAGSGVLRIATGGGKTVLGSAIIASLERPAVFLVHRLDLMHQVLDVLRGTVRDGQRIDGLFMYPELVGQVGSGVYEPNIVTVMTVQTICAALGIDTEETDELDVKDVTTARAHRDQIIGCLSRAEVVLVDECHHVPADTIYAVLEKMGRATFRFGLSATDWRDDGADILIEAALGKRLVNITLSDLVKLKYLVPARIKVYDIKNRDAWGLANERNYQKIYSKYVVNNMALNEKVVEVNQCWHAEGRTILTLVTAIKHGEMLTEMMSAAGIPTVFLSGKDKVDFRKEVLNDIRSKTLRSLVATSIADEGLDLPSLDAINLAGGGRSSTKVYQRIGRSLRPTPGKTEGLVADYYIHGHKTVQEHAEVRERMYKREPAFKLVGSNAELFAA